eukprot:7573607-Heterocapsa_arctica.AAC.1
MGDRTRGANRQCHSRGRRLVRSCSPLAIGVAIPLEASVCIVVDTSGPETGKGPLVKPSASLASFMECLVERTAASS